MVLADIDVARRTDGQGRAAGVVLLNSGVTSKTEVARVCGYADHSVVPKRLAQIRHTAEAYFVEN
ncbi:hypothetical protein [Crossiella sp. NPDC003009]